MEKAIFAENKTGNPSQEVFYTYKIMSRSIMMEEFKTEISSFAESLAFEPSIHLNVCYNIEIMKDVVPCPLARYIRSYI